ncbi:exocyst complex protein exo70 [Camillea tinctor]|nr:exocyst complex protein exo70 [Camillea tinctor]
MGENTTSAVLHRTLHREFPRIASGSGHYLTLEDGRKIFDASGGAAVACIGHGDARVHEAIVQQLSKVSYCSTSFYTTGVCEQLCQELVDSTHGAMKRAYIVGSGSEAMEAAMKLSRQYFLEKRPSEPKRTRFIARENSYHGTTLGSLSMGGHVSRRAKFEPMLLGCVSKVSRCFPFRDRLAQETDEIYIQRLAIELDEEFQRVGPETVCAFVAEPVVGAALGCVPAIPGYLKAMKSVCDKHGALLILDEVMCGMGRTGKMHAWEHDGVAPDLQTIGKCLGGGYQPIAGVLIGSKVVDALTQGSGSFVHGHTYQGHPIACAAALEVQRIVREEKLIQNAAVMGELLSSKLNELLASHPNVGSIRGRGLFWGIEFVSDKTTKAPFPSSDHIAERVSELGLTAPYSIAVYPGAGTVDGINGDHIIVSPPYNITADDVEKIAVTIQKLVHDYFASKDSQTPYTMAVGLSNSRRAADEEARAEVDVLNSRLEKTTQLTKKIQLCLGRLEATGRSVHEVSGPLNGETKKLQTLGNNIDAVLAAIERLRQPADSKNDEENIIRQGPEKAGLLTYLNSIKRLNKSLEDMKASNLRANQQTMTDLQRLVKTGNTQLETSFDKLLRSETPRSIEPLNFITKDKPFPVLTQDTISRLGLMNSYVSGNTSSDNPLVKIYADIRGPYLSQTLVNLAYASVNTAKKKNPDAMYRAGTNGIGMYAQAMEGLFVAEYDNICNIFMRQDWGAAFQTACQAPLAELARTIRELNNHIKVHLNTDCYLAYEMTEVISNLSTNLETRTGELKATLAAALKPVRDTAKLSLAELFEDTKRKAESVQVSPDGSPMPVVSETMQRLQTMVDFLRPISSIMLSIGDHGWESAAAANTSTDLASFDPGADGNKIFAKYCIATIKALLVTDNIVDSLAKGKSEATVGVFLANSVAIIERTIFNSNLKILLEDQLEELVSGKLSDKSSDKSSEKSLEKSRRKAKNLYTGACREVTLHLFDVQHTSQPQSKPEPTSRLMGKRREKEEKKKETEIIKNKVVNFNASFEGLIERHKSYNMEPEVRQMLTKVMQGIFEPLYNRFWDRYHEVIKDKYKWDKATFAAEFIKLY